MDVLLIVLWSAKNLVHLDCSTNETSMKSANKLANVLKIQNFVQNSTHVCVQVVSTTSTNYFI